MVYSVLTQLQYISFLATCFGFYKTNLRPLLTVGSYIQCVHTLWDPMVYVHTECTFICSVVRISRLNWIGLNRMDSKRKVSQVLRSNTQGSRLKRTTKKDLAELCINSY